VKGLDLSERRDMAFDVVATMENDNSKSRL
jgi:hypothetical protein